MINYKEYTERIQKMSTDNLVEEMFHMVINWGEQQNYSDKLPIESEQLQARLKLDDLQMSDYVKAYLTTEVMYHQESYLENVDVSLSPDSLKNLIWDFHNTWAVNRVPNPLMVALHKIQDLEELLKYKEEQIEEMKSGKLTEHQLEWVSEAIKYALKEANVDDLIEVEIGHSKQIELSMDESGLHNDIISAIEERNEDED